MLKYIVLTIVFFLLEGLSIYAAGGVLGGLFTFYILIVEIFVGFSVLRSGGAGALMSQPMTGAPPAKALIMLPFGMLIAFPGFFSDLLGCMLFIPPVRRFLAKVLKPDQAYVQRVLAKQMQKNGMNMFDENFMRNASAMFGRSGDITGGLQGGNGSYGNARQSGTGEKKADAVDAEYKEL